MYRSGGRSTTSITYEATPMTNGPYKVGCHTVVLGAPSLSLTPQFPQSRAEEEHRSVSVATWRDVMREEVAVRISWGVEVWVDQTLIASYYGSSHCIVPL